MLLMQTTVVWDRNAVLKPIHYLTKLDKEDNECNNTRTVDTVPFSNRNTF
jgi:hypothetical protein